MADSFSIKARSVALPHGDLSWLEAGDGDPVVLLHGVGSAARSFCAQIEGLAPRWRVLAWNAPGYGDSSPLPDDAPDVGAYAATAAAWLDACGVKACHLVGHSLGSLIAARFAATYPERVKTLTLASCAIGHARLPAEERARLLNGRIGDVDALGARGMAEKRGPRLLGPDAKPEHVRAVVDVMAAIHPRGYAPAARMLSGGDMLADIARLPATLPTQVIYGTADVITLPEPNQRAAAARANIPVAIIERAGHALYVEQPARFNALLEEFMEAKR